MRTMNAADMSRVESISYRLARVLRHKAEKWRLQVDEQGFVKISELLKLKIFSDLKTCTADFRSVELVDAQKRFEFVVKKI